MTEEFFLKIDGIPGESKDAKHKDEIEVDSIKWGAEQPTSMGSSGLGGGGVGKAKIEEFQFVMKLSKASPKLFLAVAQGTHIGKAVVTARKAGGRQEEFLVYTFKDVMVSKYQIIPTIPGKSWNVHMEEVALGFAEVEIEYKEQKADGLVGPSTKIKFNLKDMK
jgi:type VI secretion system secreted protein Hcp